jgi:putative N6-adenine-specific DNA methylase
LESGFGKVRFAADTPGLYRALMGLRAADRVLLEAARFPARDFDALFEGVHSLAWEALIPRGMGLAISKVRVNRSQLQALTSIQGVVHKAAADRLCRAYRMERLPENGLMAELRVYIEKDEVSVLLDLSGEPLFKRGYRTEGGIAPLRETTAAAILLLANWRRKFPLYDPFCGSGTIAIEAALYAWDMAPGLDRRFALQDLLLRDPAIERAVRQEFLARVDFSRTIRIFGSDADSRAISIAKSNAVRAWELAGTEQRGGDVTPQYRRGIRLEYRSGEEGDTAALPKFRVLPFRDAAVPLSGSGDEPEGFIVTNPPYGIRLGDQAEAEATYREMGELSQRFKGWKLAVITDHPGFESHFGKKADWCKEIMNGANPSFLYQYEKL